MKLWTWHSPGFSLTSGPFDITQSFFYQNYAAFPAAYAELARLVGTEKLIWCFVGRECVGDKGWPGRVEWSLDVPDVKVLRIMDTFIWNKIIGEKTYPESLRIEWMANAPATQPERDEYMATKTAEYHAQLPPPKGWWSKLFVAELNAERTTALIEHPISESWVVEKSGPFMNQYDVQRIVDDHSQKYLASCSGSLVEMMLKLSGAVANDYYAEQERDQNANVGLTHIADKTIQGKTFRHFVWQNDGSSIRKVNEVLSAGSFVGIYLPQPRPHQTFVHAWVIAGIRHGKEFLLFTKNSELGAGEGARTIRKWVSTTETAKWAGRDCIYYE